MPSGIMNLKKLSPKHISFIEFIVLGIERDDAARRSGFTAAVGKKLVNSPLVAAQIEARRVERNAAAQEQINALTVAALDEAGVDAKRTITELARVGFSDPRQIFDENNNLIDIKNWPDHVAAAVAAIEIEERTRGSGENIEHYYVKKIKYWPKVTALMGLMEHLGIASPPKKGGTGRPALHIHMHEMVPELPHKVRAGALTIDMQEVAAVGADD